MPQRLFVLDTNVLMHDPMALFNFDEHDVYLPMVVLEELDRGKKGMSEVARNVRQISRYIDQLVDSADEQSIAKGISLHGVAIGSDLVSGATGSLIFQTQTEESDLPESLAGGKADNQILRTTLGLQDHYPDKNITLVTKDINLRIKARIMGLSAEDYSTDQLLDDASLLYRGHNEMGPEFWGTEQEELESWADHDGRVFYRIHGKECNDLHLNQCLSVGAEQSQLELLVRETTSDGNDQSAVLEVARNFREGKQAVWGVHARNREQNFALNLLMDPNVDFVTLVGQAGTGKTLLALAAGLAQTLDDNVYSEIIVTRVTVPVGEDIGFLPGTEEEKMTPWMGALMDNLEVLGATSTDQSGDWERAAANDLLSRRVKVRSLNFMRGRTFLNRYVILDEAQNLTAKQMRTLITRAGPNTKVICLGNLAQIDTPYLTESSSGLAYVVERFRGWPHGGHIVLSRGERSRLADYASDVL